MPNCVGTGMSINNFQGDTVALNSDSQTNNTIVLQFCFHIRKHTI